MHMGYNNIQAEYAMNDVKLECISEEKDLGVLISDDLQNEKQCSAAVMKANRMLGMIKQNFADRSKETIIPLYKTLVRPHLEYCSQVWSPHYDKDIKFAVATVPSRRHLQLQLQGYGTVSGCSQRTFNKNSCDLFSAIMYIKILVAYLIISYKN